MDKIEDNSVFQLKKKKKNLSTKLIDILMTLILRNIFFFKFYEKSNYFLFYIIYIFIIKWYQNFFK